MRYAIYHAPPKHHPLHEAASRWLGRDAITGRSEAIAAAGGFGAEALDALTAEPRRYGFHATLKAPFHLAKGVSEADLVDAFHRFAANRPTVVINPLVLGRLGPFFALVPERQDEATGALADACVRHFEPFRAPLSPEDIARRRPETLSPSERRNLTDWGYPYVFDDFRFHMTLTGPVGDAEAPAMADLIARTFSAFVGRPHAVSHLALFAEPARGRPFHAIALAALGAAPELRSA